MAEANKHSESTLTQMSEVLSSNQQELNNGKKCVHFHDCNYHRRSWSSLKFEDKEVQSCCRFHLFTSVFLIWSPKLIEIV